jgi:acyl-CoA reductase-like NAD-dependent aldehyde dehydrogenase
VRLTGETIPSTDATKRMWTFYRPVGTWAIITPWNYPLLMFAEFVAPGLATGNAHVVKPPAHTAFTVLAAMDVLREAGRVQGPHVDEVGTFSERMFGGERLPAIVKPLICGQAQAI